MRFVYVAIWLIYVLSSSHHTLAKHHLLRLPPIVTAPEVTRAFSSRSDFYPTNQGYSKRLRHPYPIAQRRRNFKREKTSEVTGVPVQPKSHYTGRFYESKPARSQRTRLSGIVSRERTARVGVLRPQQKTPIHSPNSGRGSSYRRTPNKDRLFALPTVMEDVDFKTWKPAKPTTPVPLVPKSLPPRNHTKGTALPVIKIPSVAEAGVSESLRNTSEKRRTTSKSTAKPENDRITGRRGSKPSRHELRAAGQTVLKEQGREGETLRLSCPSAGAGSYPTGTTFLWTSPENMPLRLGQSGPRHTVQPNGGLVIQSLTTIDEGRYVCSVTVKNKTTHNSTVYVSIEDCSVSPCMNGGECDDLDGSAGTRLICRCLDSYEGRYCETKKNLYYLLIPFIGSGFIVLAIIVVVAKYTCFKKKTAPLPTAQSPAKPPEQSKVNELDVKSEKLDLPKVGPTGTQPQRNSGQQPPLEKASKAYLSRYNVAAQYGSPAYWPDRRYSYTKFQDGVVTQTGQPADHQSQLNLQREYYVEGETQIAPLASDHRQRLPPRQSLPPFQPARQPLPPFQPHKKTLQPFQPARRSTWDETGGVGPNGSFITNLPGSFHEYPTVPVYNEGYGQPFSVANVGQGTTGQTPYQGWGYAPQS